jgi:hypothetical protein
VYVPNSTSDLYNYNFKSVRQANPHELLFEQQGFSQFNPNPDQRTVGAGIFMNNTRVQVRDLTKTNQKC